MNDDFNRLVKQLPELYDQLLKLPLLIEGLKNTETKGQLTIVPPLLST